MTGCKSHEPQSLKVSLDILAGGALKVLRVRGVSSSVWPASGAEQLEMAMTVTMMMVAMTMEMLMIMMEPMSQTYCLLLLNT